jgi:hypothetical protein
MVSTQPILSLKYFKFKKNVLPENIKGLFYLSWEDALWDILSKKNIKHGSCILVPDFYCSDVEKNMKLHGCRLAFYKINNDLSADKESFVSQITKFKPQVIIIFHPVGIKSNLLENPKWLVKTVGDSILIEDSVHRVVDPKDFKIFKKNHFIINSLRKVVPIQGSWLYGDRADLDFYEPPFYQSFGYRIRVNILWFLMVAAWTLKLFTLAEKLMLIGYDLIGDSILPAKGSYIAKFLAVRLDSRKIEETKNEQVIYYEKELGKILPIKLSISDKDKRKMRGFPVVLSQKNAKNILNFLRGNGLLVRFELNDSGWSKKQKIIYLPLGIYMTRGQQTMVCNLVRSVVLHR